MQYTDSMTQQQVEGELRHFNLILAQMGAVLFLIFVGIPYVVWMIIKVFLIGA